MLGLVSVCFFFLLRLSACAYGWELVCMKLHYCVCEHKEVCD